jgi:hypothetical protein
LIQLRKQKTIETMKTRISFQKMLLILVLMIGGLNASKAMEINSSGFGKISGSVCSADEYESLEFITVTVYSATDSSMVAGTISSTDGSFSVSMLNTGQYYLEIGDAPFKKSQVENIVISAANPKVDVGRIALHPGEARKKTVGIFGF